MKITKDSNFHVVCIEDDGATMETQSINAVILHEILQVLKELKKETSVLTTLSNNLINSKKGGE